MVHGLCLRRVPEGGEGFKFQERNAIIRFAIPTLLDSSLSGSMVCVLERMGKKRYPYFTLRPGSGDLFLQPRILGQQQNSSGVSDLSSPDPSHGDEKNSPTEGDHM